MSLTVIVRETALPNLARIRSEDKDLFTRTRRAISALAGQPYREGAVAWGATGVYRLHAGDIRILYEADDQAATVHIINIGIIAWIRPRHPGPNQSRPVVLTTPSADRHLIAGSTATVAGLTPTALSLVGGATGAAQ